MGKIYRHEQYFTTTTRWILDYDRVQRLKKKVQEPLQRNHYKRRHDQTGKYIIPAGTKRHVIKKYINSYGDTVKIYDTNEIRILDEVFCQYSLYPDMRDMLRVIQNRKVPKGKYGEEFVKRIYTVEELEHIYTKKELFEYY